MKLILGTRARATAVMASNDLTAIGAMHAIAEAGLRVPGEIPVIGFEDIQLSAFTMPPLTTVNLPRTQIANAAFRVLLKMQQSNALKPVQGEEHMVRPTLCCASQRGLLRARFVGAARAAAGGAAGLWVAVLSAAR